MAESLRKVAQPLVLGPGQADSGRRLETGPTRDWCGEGLSGPLSPQ